MKNTFFEKQIEKSLRQNKNRTYIELCINDEKELFNRFSVLNEPDIPQKGNAKVNNEIIDYLINESENAPVKDSLTITVKTLKKLSYSAEYIQHLIKESVYGKLAILKKLSKKLQLHSFVLALSGMFLIALTQILPVIEKRYPLNEFVIVMSWVFMWKAVDLFFFEKTRLLKEQRTLMKIYFSEIGIGEL